MSGQENIFQYDGCIDTYSGLRFSFLNPKPEQISIEDIARGLAFRGHFGGQSERFFSIAQHSVLTLDLMLKERNVSNKMKLVALLHDASEAYTGDMVKPLKNLIPEFKKIEDGITKVIFEKFGLDADLMACVKKYDLAAQRIEYFDFFCGEKRLGYLSPERSAAEFIETFHSCL